MSRLPSGGRSIAVRRSRSTRPRCRWCASAAAVAAIVAKGAPVYGINTGFGKLASVRIEREDLATLQRNIVLSHAAGVGEPMPASVVRLMMALKLVSLAQGASGIREETLLLLEAMLVRACCRWCPRRARWVPRATWRRSRTWPA